MNMVCHHHKRMQAIMPQLASSSFDHYGDTFRHGHLLQPNRTANGAIEDTIHFSKVLAERFAVS